MGSRRRFHFKDKLPQDPALRRWSEWLPENCTFYAAFRQWLNQTGYSSSALGIYGCAARQMIGLLDKPYWTFDLDADPERVRQYWQTRSLSPHTLAEYYKGLLKFVEYLRLRLEQPAAPKLIHWECYLGGLPAWLQDALRGYIAHCQRSWLPDRRYETSVVCLSRTTQSLRWMQAQKPLASFSDITPNRWLDYTDARLQAGIQPPSLTGELTGLLAFMHYLQDLEQPICERLLLVQPFKEGRGLPRDAPVEILRQLHAQILAETQSTDPAVRRTGRMDHAWFLLMLHSGLRTCEVRHLKQADIDWTARRVRIEQSKGLKDRLVCLSEATVTALQAYLEVRGPADVLPAALFVYRHKPLTQTYCYKRLRTYGERCDAQVSPHQLRHSHATLLLNAGAPVATVQTLLGHKHVDTTLGYARLYDGTVAADYYQAMAMVERQLALPEDRLSQPPTVGVLVALVDSLRQGTLSPDQAETAMQLRAGLLALAEALPAEKNMTENVKVLAQAD